LIVGVRDQIHKESSERFDSLKDRRGVAFLFKQRGGRNKKAAGRLLNGRTYEDMPEIMETEKLK
jgi:protein gp37